MREKHKHHNDDFRALRTVPALQTSGQYTFWLCWVESQATPRTVGRIHRRAEERGEEVKRPLSKTQINF